jgi:hypothetical protein
MGGGPRHLERFVRLTLGLGSASGDGRAHGVTERVLDRVGSVGADVARQERFDVGPHGVPAGVLGNADDRTGAAQRRECGGGIGVAERARHIGELLDPEPAVAKKSSSASQPHNDGPGVPGGSGAISAPRL